MDILKAFGVKKARPMAYPGFNAPGMGMEPDDPTSRPSTKWDTGRRREGPTAPGQPENWRNVMAGRSGAGQAEGTPTGYNPEGRRGFWQRTDKYEQARGLPQANPEQQKWNWRDAKEWAGQVTSKDPAEQAKARPGGGAYEGWTQTLDRQDPAGGNARQWHKTGVGPDPQITPMSQARKPGKFWWTNPKPEVKQYDIPDYGPQG